MDPGNKIHGREHLEAMLERTKRKIGETMSDETSDFQPSPLWEAAERFTKQVVRIEFLRKLVQSDSDELFFTFYGGSERHSIPRSFLQRGLLSYWENQLAVLRECLHRVQAECLNTLSEDQNHE